MLGIWIYLCKFVEIFIVMSLLRAIVCIICPPLAVLDKGCGSVLLVTVLTVVGWVPGVIAAIFICNK
jgi:uncharacterized membrane protein YqaE (UPF0057 family)